jgi:hypothetical protein
MPSYNVEIRLRPLKLAFLVYYKDIKGLLEAIKTNTFLWGGQYNPIIPVFMRCPKVWSENISENKRVKDIIQGYLANFDPDFVVPIGQAKEIHLDITSRKQISVEEITEGIKKEGLPKYGIGLREILDHYVKTEFKYVRRKPIHICFPSFRNPYLTFMASVFGALNKETNIALVKMFGSALNPECPSWNLVDYAPGIKPGCMFLRRLSSLYIHHNPANSWDREIIFVMDAGIPLDIMDYWNLRALGKIVLPVPAQAACDESVKKLVSDFVEDCYYPINDTVNNQVTILKSRNLSKTNFENIVQNFGVASSGDRNKPKYVTQHWYPRLWNEWAWDKDNVLCCDVEESTKEYSISGGEENTSLRTLDPEFIHPHFYCLEPRFANEIKFRLYGNEPELFGRVIPEGDERMARAVGCIGIDDYRVSRNGIVHFESHKNGLMFLSLPKGEDLFREWFKQQGWEIELSSPGRLAKQMLKHLGGILGISRIAQREVIDLLEKMEGGAQMTHDAFIGEISKIANKGRFPREVNDVLKNFLESKMFNLGLQVQCQTCTQHIWVPFNEFNYTLKCTKCLDHFEVPQDYPTKKLEWAYRTLGPFNLPNRAFGVYSVLLTLWFFMKEHSYRVTPILSFNAKKDKKELEADLGLFLQQQMFGYSKRYLIFAECKTMNLLEKDDIDKMAILGNEFPGAILVFAILRDSFVEREKKLLRSLVKKGRKSWKADHPFNPVLILTAKELFSWQKPPYCWEKAEGKCLNFSKATWIANDIIELCDVSQQIYLDMDSRFKDMQKKYAKRKPKGMPTKPLEESKNSNLGN